MQTHFRLFYPKKIFAGHAFFSKFDIWPLFNGESLYMFFIFCFFYYR